MACPADLCHFLRAGGTGCKENQKPVSDLGFRVQAYQSRDHEGWT